MPFPKADHGLTVITYGIKAPCSRHAIGYRVITHNFKSGHCSNIVGKTLKSSTLQGNLKRIEIYKFTHLNQDIVIISMVFTSAEREVKDSRRPGVYQS